jgi:hypothetical protein
VPEPGRGMFPYRLTHSGAELMANVHIDGSLSRTVVGQSGRRRPWPFVSRLRLGREAERVLICPLGDIRSDTWGGDKGPLRFSLRSAGLLLYR